jgi:hypothetical protein
VELEEEKIQVSASGGAPSVLLTDEVADGGPVGLLKGVFLRSWGSRRAVFLDEVAFEPLVFPLFATLLHTKVLTTETDQTLCEAAIEAVSAGIGGRPDSLRHSLLLVLALVLILRDNRARFDPDRFEKATAMLESTFSELLGRYVRQRLADASILVNRFATAAFHAPDLLQDFRDVAHAIRTSTLLPPSLERVATQTAFWVFDRQLLNKMIASPERFTIANANTWDAFLTNCESAERVPLPLIRQAVSALVLGVGIGGDETLVRAACPDLPPPVLAFLLKNEGSEASSPALPLDFPIDFDCLKQASETANWSIIATDEESFAGVEYLLQYAQGRQ